MFSRYPAWLQCSRPPALDEPPKPLNSYFVFEIKPFNAHESARRMRAHVDRAAPGGFEKRAAAHDLASVLMGPQEQPVFRRRKKALDRGNRRRGSRISTSRLTKSRAPGFTVPCIPLDGRRGEASVFSLLCEPEVLTIQKTGSSYARKAPGRCTLHKELC